MTNVRSTDVRERAAHVDVGEKPSELPTDRRARTVPHRTIDEPRDGARHLARLGAIRS